MSIEKPTPRMPALFSVQVILAVLITIGVTVGVMIIQQLLDLRRDINIVYVDKQAHLVQQIFENAKVDQDVCYQELNEKPGLVTLNEIKGLLERDINLAGEETLIKIRAVLKPYRDCLERRARMRKEEYRPIFLLTSKDI